MITTLSRIIHFGLKSFWRNGLLSTATVLVMLLALFVSLGLIVFSEVKDTAVVSLKEKIDIVVYFKTNTAEDQILSIKQSLESLPEVKEIEYVSKEKALEDFKAKHKDEQSVIGAVDTVGSNPFEASLNIRAFSPDQYATIDESLNSSVFDQYISKKSFDENQVAIDRLVAIIDYVNRGGLALTIIMTIIAGLIVFNTIRLAIYSSRDEISIMRAVGASNSLVRGPFIVDGILVGVIAAVLSILFVMPVVSFLSPHLAKFIPGSDLSNYFYSSLFSLLGLQILFGAGIGVFSSFMAIRRYLKN